MTILSLFFFLSVSFCNVFAETVLHRFKAQEPDKPLEELLYLTAGVALTQAGFSSTRKGDNPDYILLSEYTFENSALKIRYTLLKPGTPEEILSVEECDLSLDYNLDEQITGALNRLLQAAGIKATSRVDAEIGELLPTSPPDNTDENTDSGLPDNDFSDDSEEQEDETAQEGHAVKFDSSASAAMVVLFGEITEYLRYGIAGVIMAGYPWVFGSWGITLGAKLSFIRVFNNAHVSGGPFYLPAAGLNLKFDINLKKSLMASAGISGGAAFITVLGTEETLAKTVPYTDAGLHLGILIKERVFIGGEVCFFMIFDQDILITGVSPAFTLRMGG